MEKRTLSKFRNKRSPLDNGKIVETKEETRERLTKTKVDRELTDHLHRNKAPAGETKILEMLTSKLGGSEN